MNARIADGFAAVVVAGMAVAAVFVVPARADGLPGVADPPRHMQHRALPPPSPPVARYAPPPPVTPYSAAPPPAAVYYYAPPPPPPTVFYAPPPPVYYAPPPASCVDPWGYLAPCGAPIPVPVW